jgi:hypothetical protein
MLDSDALAPYRTIRIIMQTNNTQLPTRDGASYGDRGAGFNIAIGFGMLNMGKEAYDNSDGDMCLLPNYSIVAGDLVYEADLRRVWHVDSNGLTKGNSGFWDDIFSYGVLLDEYYNYSWAFGYEPGDVLLCTDDCMYEGVQLTKDKYYFLQGHQVMRDSVPYAWVTTAVIEASKEACIAEKYTGISQIVAARADMVPTSRLSEPTFPLTPLGTVATHTIPAHITYAMTTSPDHNLFAGDPIETDIPPLDVKTWYSMPQGIRLHLYNIHTVGMIRIKSIELLNPMQ